MRPRLLIALLVPIMMFLPLVESSSAGETLTRGATPRPHDARGAATTRPISVGASLPHGPEQAWVLQTVDQPKMFSNMGDRSLALDNAGYPHIAYGQDQLYYAWRDSTGWHRETVDASAGVGQYTSLALDSVGHPHIGYYDEVNGDLKYARYDGSVWQTETIDSAGDVGRYASLALDAANRPHISYCLYDAIHQYCSQLQYVYDDGTGWQIEIADNTAGAYTSLVLDNAGQPRINYFGPLALKYATRDTTGWHIETVDDSLMYWAGDTSLATDADGHPHIAYRDGYTRNYLKYAYYDGTVWQIQIVDIVLGRPSLRLTTAGQPQICYRTYLGLQYARYNGASWDIEVLASLGPGSDISLALDTNDQPHISHNGWPDLQYAYYDGSSWLQETVDWAETVGLYSSVTLDAAGRPRIAYQSETYGDLMYAAFDGGQWQSETVDSNGGAGEYVSLVLDTLGQPHVSYMAFDTISYWLRYAHSSDSTWQIEALEQGGQFSADSNSLALDADMHPHIIYLNTSDPRRIRYGRYDGSGWQFETLEGGWGASLTLDSNGLPRMSYGSGGLRYAYYDGTTWHFETVDPAPTGPRYTSIALDTVDNPHIAYQGDSTGGLRYAVYDGDTWITETVDGGDGIGRYPSLCLDVGGHSHISYYDADNGDLKYAHHGGTSWQIEIVDSVGRVGAYTSLAADKFGQPHISYYDATNGDLKYAYRTASYRAYLPVLSKEYQP